MSKGTRDPNCAFCNNVKFNLGKNFSHDFEGDHLFGTLSNINGHYYSGYLDTPDFVEEAFGEAHQNLLEDIKNQLGLTDEEVKEMKKKQYTEHQTYNCKCKACREYKE